MDDSGNGSEFTTALQTTRYLCTSSEMSREHIRIVQTTRKMSEKNAIYSKLSTSVYRCVAVSKSSRNPRKTARDTVLSLSTADLRCSQVRRSDAAQWGRIRHSGSLSDTAGHYQTSLGLRLVDAVGGARRVVGVDVEGADGGPRRGRRAGGVGFGADWGVCEQRE